MMETNKTLPQKCKSPSNPQMLNRKRSISSSSINVEESTLLGLQAKVPLHRRSASYPLSLPDNSELISVTDEGDLESCRNDFITKIQANDDTKKSENSLSQFAENPNSGDDARLHQESSIETEDQELDRNFEPDMDPKKIKRMLANRQSARRSRIRKVEYIEKLKREIQAAEAKVNLLSPQVSYYEHRRKMLEKENNEMKQRMEALEKEKVLKEAEFEALMEEREVLSLVYNLLQDAK